MRFAMDVITKDVLLDTLSMVVDKGDDRWAGKDEVVSIETIRELISDQLSEDNLRSVLKGMGIVQAATGEVKRMAMEVITKDELLDALTMVVNKGDSRWANQSEVVSQETISQMISENLDEETIRAVLEGMGVLQDEDVGGLSDDEMNDLLGAL